VGELFGLAVPTQISTKQPS